MSFRTYRLYCISEEYSLLIIFLVKITIKIDLNYSPRHDIIHYIKRKALALFKTKLRIVEPNRATFEYNYMYSISTGILCFCSCVRQQTRVEYGYCWPNYDKMVLMLEGRVVSFRLSGNTRSCDLEKCPR